MKRFLFNLAWFCMGMCLLGACSAAGNSGPTPAIVLDPVIPDTPTPESSCTSISTEPTSAPGAASLFPPVSQSDFSIGPQAASVTLVEYCEFQSQGCNGMATVVGELMRNHANLRFVFRPLPLIDVLDKSDKAVLAALAADEQGKFWEMYDLLFVKHNEWAGLNPNQFNAWVIRDAAAFGMDQDQLRSAIAASETTARMTSLYEAARALNIPAVPLVLINGALQPSYVLDYQSLSDAIGLIELGERQFRTCPPFNIDAAKQYIATIKTEKGDIVIELLPDKAPLAVNSFVFLARQGWFDDVSFHRVIPGFLAQSGDPSGTGKGNPGYFYNNEITDLKFDRPGLVAMANSGPATNGSQFFITFAPAPHLDGGYTIFGRVISGLDVAESLTPRDPDQGGSIPAGDRIIRIEVEEK